MPARFGDQILDQIKAIFRGSEAPGLDVAVAVSGEVVLRSCFGVCDSRTKQPLTRGRLFRAKGFVKPLLGLLYMELEREGRLSLDAPVEDMSQELDVDMCSCARGRTLRELLALFACSASMRCDLEDTPSGPIHRESEIYRLLRAVAEKATGRTLSDLMEELVLRRLQLDGMCFEVAAGQGGGEGSPAWPGPHRRPGPGARKRLRSHSGGPGLAGGGEKRRLRSGRGAMPDVVSG